MMRRYGSITNATLRDAAEVVAANGRGSRLALATASGNRPARVRKD
jgi:hypothetical protein